MSTPRNAAVLAASALFLVLAGLAPACKGLHSYAEACKKQCQVTRDCGSYNDDDYDLCVSTCDYLSPAKDEFLDGCANRDEILDALADCISGNCGGYVDVCLSYGPVCTPAAATTTTTTTSSTTTTTSAGTYACDKAANGLHVCTQFTAPHTCEAGTTLVYGCQVNGLLGTCVFGTGTAGAFTVYYYSGGGYTLDAAQKACGGGVWTTYGS